MCNFEEGNIINFKLAKCGFKLLIDNIHFESSIAVANRNWRLKVNGITQRGQDQY